MDVTYTSLGVKALIKQDIIHQVIAKTGLPRNKAEAAVDTVFESLKKALASRRSYRVAGLWRLQCAPPQNRNWTQSADRRRSHHHSRQSRSFQAGQRTPPTGFVARPRPKYLCRPRTAAPPSSRTCLIFRGRKSACATPMAGRPLCLLVVSIVTTASTGALLMQNFRLGNRRW